MYMRGKTIVITGATSGIGEVAAIRLAGQGARIVFTARDRDRAEVTLTNLRAANCATEHRYFLADLSLLAEMKRAAGEIAAAAPHIDVLINNAGALFNKRTETADGLEKTFALNHMAYFVVSNLLMPHIVDGGRIVNVSTRAHRNAALNFDDLQSRHGYLGFPVYSKSKLCNILFTRELARRSPRGVTVNCLHPGFVATRFGDQSGGVMQRLVSVAKPVGAISPEEGAKAILYLASSPEVSGVTGEYFYKCRVETPSEEACNNDDAQRLWDASAKIAGLPF
jgi:NAD(P)-dependent dehydrogenase (short-subunit alcohol dehydrogenase family)